MWNAPAKNKLHNLAYSPSHWQRARVRCVRQCPRRCAPRSRADCQQRERRSSPAKFAPAIGQGWRRAAPVVSHNQRAALAPGQNHHSCEYTATVSPTLLATAPAPLSSGPRKGRESAQHPRIHCEVSRPWEALSAKVVEAGRAAASTAEFKHFPCPRFPATWGVGVLLRASSGCPKRPTRQWPQQSQAPCRPVASVAKLLVDNVVKPALWSEAAPPPPEPNARNASRLTMPVAMQPLRSAATTPSGFGP